MALEVTFKNTAKAPGITEYMYTYIVLEWQSFSPISTPKY